MKVNEIEIKITKAVITKISIEIDDDGPIFHISGSLFTDNGMKISEINFSNQSWWAEDKKIEVPVEVFKQSLEMFKVLNPIICEKINGSFKGLKSPNKEGWDF